MTGLLGRLRPWWQVQRVRRPRLVERAEDVATAARGQDGLAREVRRLRARLAELERDHLLLAAHVARLTERPAGGAQAPDDDALQRARLAAMAFYEERIGALEEQVGAVRHARRAPGRAAIARTSDERRGRAG